MPPRSASGSWHLAVSALVGAVAGVGVAIPSGPLVGALVAWAVAGTVFLVWTWTTVWRLDEDGTARHASLEDPSRRVRELVVVLLAVVSLLTVGLVIFRAQDSGPLRLVLGVLCVIDSWAVLHTIYVLKYARLFYSEPVGGIDYHEEGDPTYRDFAYLGFTVGMTFQVSDTDIVKPAIRATILGHALLSFMFGAVILAVTINLIAGLSP